MTAPDNFEALLPPEMAARAGAIGERKAKLGAIETLLLAVLAGAYIAMGAVFATTVSAGGPALPYGVMRLLSGLVFSVGLMMVVVGGAELFTGNNLIVMAWASKRVSLGALLRNWALVYLGNFVGAVASALLVFGGGQYLQGAGAVGLAALNTANAKCALDPLQAMLLGVLCNALVCMAVWMSYSARSTVDRLLAVLMPVAAFVAAGFEHSIANMYFVPAGLLIKQFAPATFWAAIARTPADFPMLDAGNFLLNNLAPVTLGNIIGGAGLVGAIYWLVYLRAPAK